MAGKNAGRHTVDLETLLAIAANGWAVLPLVPGQKRPAIAEWQHNATTDPEQIEAWHAENASLNWGTLSATVADIDDMAQADDILAMLPDAPTQKTASGNMHVLMSSDEAKRLPAKLPGRAGDWRVRGRGFVVIYDPAPFLEHSPDSLPAVPEEMYARARASTRSEPITSRNEIIAVAGHLRAAGMGRDTIYDSLVAMLENGDIENADESWPWEESDLAKIADEAGKWAAGNVVPMPKVRTASGSAIGPRLVQDDEPGEDDWLGAVPLSDVELTDPVPLVLSRIHPTGHTILYGTGGVGKGVVAASWIAEITAAGQRVLLLDYEQNPDEWRRRVQSFGGDPALVLIANPHGLAWSGIRGPIWKQASQLADLALRWDASFVFVDSIVMAAAGAKDPYSPEAPALYASALELIGLPTVSLAHVNRSDDGRYPFGSVFWHNLSRITWSIEASESGNERILKNRKANSYKVAPPQAIDWAWVDDEDKLPPRLSYTDVVPSTADRIFEALQRLGGQAGLDAIAVELPNDGFEAVSKSGVGKALKRYSKGDHQRFVDHGSGTYAILGKVSTRVSTEASSQGAPGATEEASTTSPSDVHAADGDVSTDVSTGVHGQGQHRPADVGVDTVHPYGGAMSTATEDGKGGVKRERTKGSKPKRRNIR